MIAISRNLKTKEEVSKMSLIVDLYAKLQSLTKPISYVELAAMMGASSLRTRNSVRDMITRGIPIKKERRYQEMYVSLNTKHTFDYFIGKHKDLAKRVGKFIGKCEELCGDDEIAAKFKITVKYAHNIVCYLSRTNGVSILKTRKDGKDYYSIAGKVYTKKAKGHFDNQCIDHLLFHGAAMEAVRIHKSINEMRG